jgi:hypothetical protein
LLRGEGELEREGGGSHVSRAVEGGQHDVGPDSETCAEFVDERDRWTGMPPTSDDSGDLRTGGENGRGPDYRCSA